MDIPKVRLYRTAAIPLLFMCCCGITYAQPGMGEQPAFSWNEYTGIDGKKYVYPQWGTNLDGSVYFMPSQGNLVVGAFTVTNAKMLMEIPGPLPGSWKTLFEKNPADYSAKVVPGDFVILTANDPNTPKVGVVAGSDISITWYVELKDAQGTKTWVKVGPLFGKAKNTPSK